MPSVPLALVVPCYNPPAGWAPRLAERFEAFAKTLATPPEAIHVVLVNDGTPGGLDDRDVRALRASLPRLTFLDSPVNRGKGHALRRGVRAAGPAALYLYTDIDLPYTADSMRAVVEHLRAHGGVAAGERFDDYYVAVPPLRRALSRGHRWAMRQLFRLPVSDSQAGLKGFDESGRQVFLETTVDRFLVDLDFISRCRGRVAVAPVRVALRPDVQFTDFGLSILRREAGNFVAILGRSWGGQ